MKQLLVINQPIDACREEDIRRFDDLQDPANQEHILWQALNPQSDRVLPRTDWITDMRVA